MLPGKGVASRLLTAIVSGTALTESYGPIYVPHEAVGDAEDALAVPVFEVCRDIGPLSLSVKSFDFLYRRFDTLCGIACGPTSGRRRQPAQWRPRPLSPEF
jgi:hypothetical protein